MRLRGASRRAWASASASASAVCDDSTELSSREFFQIGDKVEVRSDDEGFRGVWYEAAVLRRLPMRQRYLVAYTSLLSEKDPSKPRREVIHRSHVRPLPPHSPPLSAEGYNLHARVEAFHNNGWWSGVVSSVLLPDLGRYIVCFPTSREVIEFRQSELRPLLHWDSACHRWIPAEEMSTREPTFKVGDMVEVSRERVNHGPAWFDATIMKAFDNSTFLVEYNNVKSKSSSELLKEILDIQYMQMGPPLASQAKDFTSGDEIEVFLDHGWLAGTVLETLSGAMFAVKLKHCQKTLKFSCDDMRYQRFCTGLKLTYKSKKARKLLDTDEVKSPKMNKKRGKSFSVPISVSNGEGEVAYDNADTFSMKCTKIKNSSKRPGSEAAASVSKSTKISSSECNARPDLDDNMEFGRGSAILSGLEIENYTSVSIVVDGSLMGEQHHSKSQPPHNFTGEQENPENSFVAFVGSEDSRKKDINQGVLGDLPERDQTNTSTASRQVDHMQDACHTSKPLSDVRSCSFQSMLTKAFKICDSPDNAILTADNLIIASPCEDSSDVHEDPTRTRSSQVVSLENERVELDPHPLALPPKKMLLPFEKSLLMWESIESMDAFSKMPQEPHFRPLEQRSIDFREGMAIGLMISFATLVSNIEKMTVSETPTAIEERLRDLEALEANGFNVTCIRMRLKELLQIQVSRTETKSRKTMLKAQMLEMREDCGRLNALIVSYDKAIGELEDNMARLREKKDLVMRTKESTESALANIEREAHEAEKASRSIEESFITKLAAPW